MKSVARQAAPRLVAHTIRTGSKPPCVVWAGVYAKGALSVELLDNLGCNNFTPGLEWCADVLILNWHSLPCLPNTIWHYQLIEYGVLHPLHVA